MKTAYTNGKILNGHEDMTPVAGLAVLVDGETITGVIPAGEVPSEYTVVDLRGGYLMPGLINLHVHIPGSGKPAKKQADTKKLVKLITSEAGKCADMIVTPQKPLEGLDALRQLDMVITKGRRFDAPKVKKMAQVEQELDRFLA